MKHVEYFKDIPGLEGVYAVSNYGRVKSYPYEDAASRQHKEFLVSQRHTYHHGELSEYWQVELCRNKNGSRKKQGLSRYQPLVHDLVAKTFGAEWTELAKKAKLFHEEDQIVVMHKNNNGGDNNINNLQFGTHLENKNDKDVRLDEHPYTVHETDAGVFCGIWGKNEKKYIHGAVFSLKKFPKDVAIAAALLNAWRLSNVVGGALYVQYAVRQEFYKRGGPSLITPEIEAIIDENIKKHRRMIEETKTEKQLEMIINDNKSVDIV